MKKKVNHKKNRKKSVEILDYKCIICGKKINIREKGDHLLCHELEKEENNREEKNKKEKERNILNVSFGEDNNNSNINNNINNFNNNISNINRASNFIFPNENPTHYIFNRFNNINSVYNLNYEYNRINNRGHYRTNLFQDSSSDSSLEDSLDGLNDKIVQNYPVTKIKNPNKLSEDKKKCLICLENFKKGDKSIALPCIHIFHSECIKCWMKKKNSCPLCKHKIKSKNK